MSEAKTSPKFEKGTRAAVVGGKKGVGVRGQVFWIGENKYGPGLRYGLRGDDGATYWLDDTQIGPESAGSAETAAPKSARPQATGPAFSKGDRVRIKASQLSGDVFWAGQSRYGDGMRYGVRDDDGGTHWVDAHEVEADGSSQPKTPASGRSKSATSATIDGPDFNEATPLGADEGLMGDPGEAVPLPDDADLPPEAFSDYQSEGPPEGFWEDLPPED